MPDACQIPERVWLQATDVAPGLLLLCTVSYNVPVVVVAVVAKVRSQPISLVFAIVDTYIAYGY